MEGVIWKAFRIRDLFTPYNGMMVSLVKKHLDVKDKKEDTHQIAIVGASGFNNGITGWLKTDQSENKEISDIITFAYDSAYSGTAFYQTEKFITTQNFGTHGALKVNNNLLKNLLDIYSYGFICSILTKIFQKNYLYGWNYKIHGEVFLREIILLPLLEVSNNNEYIWEEHGKFWTLAVDYIKELMQKAKHRKEEKTIRLYEAEKAKYEAEKAKYEAAYLKEQSSLVWKAFQLGELFIFKNERDHTIAVKNIDKSDIRDDFYNVSVVTESMFNNGVGFYMNENDPIVLSRLREPGMTCGSQFGNVNFQEKKYICIGNIYSIFEKDSNFKRVLDTSKFTYNFISNSINKVMNKSGIYGYMYKSTTEQYEREIILLPVIEIKGTDEYIWEENGKYFTLAVNTMSYLYLQGQVNIQQKKIDTYTYRY